MNILWSVAKLPIVEWKKWCKQLFLNAWSISIQEKFDRFGKRWIGKTCISAIRDSMFWAVSHGYFFHDSSYFFQFKARFQRSWWRPLSRRMPTSSKLTTQNFGSISRREISKKFVKVKILLKKPPSDSSAAKILVKQGSLTEGEGSVQLTSLN